MTMHSTVMRKAGGSPAGGWRRALRALMFVAIGLVVLRPVCDAVMVAQDNSVQVCCAVVEDGTLVNSPDPIGAGKPDTGAAIPLAAALFAIGTIVSLQRARVPASAYPPTPQSFYLRSARIRR